MTTPTDFAILAPVPQVHLDDGVAVAAREGFVAFGSRKWELFRKIDELRRTQPVPVLIYPSHEDILGKLAFRVCWIGEYVGHVESVAGAHPDGMCHRPPSTADHPSDNRGYWAVFWHVRKLAPLPSGKDMSIGELQAHASGTWRKNAPPRGPDLVYVPPELASEVAAL